MRLLHQHEDRSPGHSSFHDWLHLRTGIAICVAVAVVGILIYTGHSGHVLGLVPYLLILACPLMHIFMHGRHSHRHGHREAGGSEDDN